MCEYGRVLAKKKREKKYASVERESRDCAGFFFVYVIR